MDLTHFIASYYSWSSHLLTYFVPINSITGGLIMTGYVSMAIMIGYGAAKWYSSRHNSRDFFEICLATAFGLVLLPIVCVLILQALPFILVGMFVVISGLALIRLIPMGSKEKDK